MTKDAGMGDQFYVDGYDIGGDIQSLQRIGGGNTPLPATDITMGGMARFGGQLDGGMEFTSYFDPAANASHATFSSLPTADRLVTWAHGSTIGNWGGSCIAKQINYDGSRAQDGSFYLNVSALSNGYGLMFGQMLTAGKRTDGSATNGSSLDQLLVSPGSFGWSLYVHLFAFTGTSVTIKVQESSDNGAGDAFADISGATTGALSSIQGLRVAALTGTVERYVRVVTTGTFSNAVFWVQWTRHRTLLSF